MALRPRSRRLLAALLGTTWLIGLFASPLHQLLVEHVRCAEHGQLVHAGDHADAGHALAEQALLIAAEAHGDHDHCDSCAVAPAIGDVEAPTLASSPGSGDGDQSDPTVVAVRAPSTDRYRIAPKQSPPV